MVKVATPLLSFVCLAALASQALAQAATPVAAPPVAAQPAAAPAGEGRSGVEQALAAYVAAFNAHDAAAVASLWTPDGVYVDKETGKRTSGREALTADFKALFAQSPQSVLEGAVEGVRMIGADAAMVDGTSLVVSPGAEPDASAYTAVFLKQNGKWMLDSVHEMALPTPESPRQALEPLAWMIGHWQDATEGVKVDSVVRWSPSEAFLIRSYYVDREGDAPFEGTQVIGWDPRAKQIRSWTFSSDGSFGEGMWSRNQDEWLVRTSQTLADGRAATATQVIKQIDANSASVQTIGKEVDGSPEPANDPVTIVRVADEPAGAAAVPPVGPAAPAGAPAGGVPARAGVAR